LEIAPLKMAAVFLMNAMTKNFVLAVATRAQELPAAEAARVLVWALDLPEAARVLARVLVAALMQWDVYPVSAGA